MLEQVDGVGYRDPAIIVHIRRIRTESDAGRLREKKLQYDDGVGDIQSPAAVGISALKPGSPVPGPQGLQYEVIGEGRAATDPGRDRQASPPRAGGQTKRA